MAYKVRGLSVHTYSNWHTIWHYKTDDTMQTVCSHDYFAEASDMMEHHDMIIIAASDADGIRFVRIDEDIRLVAGA